MVKVVVYYVNQKGHDCVKEIEIDALPEMIYINGAPVWRKPTGG